MFKLPFYFSVIEVSLNEHGHHAYDLMKSIDNGKSSKWMSSRSVGNMITSMSYFLDIELQLLKIILFLEDVKSSEDMFDEIIEIKKLNRSSFIELITLLKRSVLIMSREKVKIASNKC